MSSETIWTRLRKRPWTPFRLKTRDGDSYDVLHSEMILLSKNTVAIAIYDQGERPGEELPQRQVYISPLHVTAVEDLPPRRSNGRQRRN